ncbi:autotransporter assembly complex protein TamA [Acidimangrovimonas pyrenivorans]|uniref:Autotransporter assembly complex family protein n=1 Tax=Acidimangrovimonas pyrenivorans TaxID=2030798 RepID=A0ABV7ACE8_9RHOB
MSGRFGFPGRRGAAALLLAAGLAQPAAALDSLDFAAPGADAGLTKSLRAASLLVTSEAEGKTDPQDLFAAARADYARLLGALYAAGYYSGVIHIRIDGREAAAIAPLDAPRAIRKISVSVAPGPAFTFGQARIAPLAPGTSLPGEFAPGQPARSDVLQAAVSSAVSSWRDAGHAKAAPGQRRIVADHPAAKLNADVAIAPGPRVTFGNLIITGRSTVREKRIRQIAGFPTGETFDPRKEEKVATRLRRAGAFRSVALTEAGTLGPGDNMDVTAALVDAKKHRIGVGAEIASLDGLTLSGYWLHRNLFNDAQRLRFDGKISGIGAAGNPDYSFSVRLDRPAVVNADSTLYALALAERLDETDYTETRAATEVGLTRLVSDRLTLSAGIGYQASRVTDSTGLTRYRDVTFPLGATYDSRDDKLDARRGTYLDAAVMPFVGFGGTGTGAQLKLDARGYRPLGKRLVLAGRLQLGSVLRSPIADTPRDYLFYSGGGGTVRGQPYQSLGVYAISPTQRSGGRSFVGLSGEVRAKLTASFGAVAFYDAGYVGATSLPDGSGSWQAGAGLGLRYFTGIGPIRLDVAAPVSGGTGKGVQIYVGIGQAF